MPVEPTEERDGELHPEPNDSGEPFRFQDSRQRRIYELLWTIGPGPAAFFKDSCQLLSAKPPFATTGHLVAHCVREIESALRDVLKTVAEPEPKSSTTKDRHRQQVLSVLRALGVQDDDPLAKGWLALTERGGEHALHARAHRAALSTRPLDDQHDDWWNGIQSLLLELLRRFQARCVRFLSLIDRLLEKDSPSQEDLDALHGRVPRVALDYFFENLSKPEWVQPLRDRGFFNDPPAANVSEKGGIGFNVWPASRYLLRMAEFPEVQELACEIALAVPETDPPNVRIHEDLVDVACALPANLAVLFVPKASEWATSAYHFSLPERLGTLIARLAGAGYPTESIDLARHALAVRQGPDGEPGGYFDDSQYEAIVHERAPVLVGKAGQPALRLLCDLLDDAVHLRHAGNKPYDGSSHWFQALDRDSGSGVVRSLVHAVRDAAENLAQRDESQVPEIVKILEDHEWQLFLRLALHLLLRFPNADADLVRERIVRRQYFDDHAFEREYRLLTQEAFDLLGEAEQERILGWIAAGPDLEAYVANSKSFLGTPPSEDEQAQYVRVWKRDRLQPLVQYVPHNWKRTYAELVRVEGWPNPVGHVEPRIKTRDGSRSESPLSTDQLLGMRIPDLLGHLREWEPESPDEFFGGRHDLGEALGRAAQQDPERFANEAAQFRDLHPTYLAALFRAFGNLVREGRSILWEPVLSLACAVTEQPKSPPVQGPSSDAPRAPWTAARFAVGRLVDAALSAQPVPIPVQLKSTVRSILKSLTEDPDPLPPTPHEAQPDQLQNSLGVAINSVRGVALQAVVRFALWQRQSASDQAATGQERDLQRLPAVRQILEQHLDPAQDPSSAIRAVYGHSLPLLAHLDSEWVRQQIQRIFPNDPEHASLHRAAWDTYLIYSRPHLPLLEIIYDEYSAAVERIGQGRRNGASQHDPEQHLADHLMVYYWHGRLPLEVGGLLARFFERATDRLRSHALAFIGRSLKATEGTIDPVILDRLATLWQSRLQTAKAQESAAGFREELGTIGWWFASGQLDDDWGLAQVQAALDLVERAEPDHLIAKRLVEVADNENLILRVVRCLRSLLEAARDDWTFYGWRDEAKAILRLGLCSQVDAVRREAQDLVNIIVSLGHLDFRALLDDESP